MLRENFCFTNSEISLFFLLFTGYCLKHAEIPWVLIDHHFLGNPVPICLYMHSIPSHILFPLGMSLFWLH